MEATERRARATHEATQWWNRLCLERPTEVSRADRELFTQWLRESPLHVAELLRIAHVHGALERFKLWSEIEVGDAGEADNVVALRERLNDAFESASATTQSAEGPPANRSRIGAWAIAAGFCLVAILAGWLALGARAQVIETELAERRQVMLDDGTVMQLEPQTKVRVRMQDDARHVALERGRAFFRVAKDEQRPFWVSTEHTSVRAVGTAFGVESSQQGVVVTVAEGTVAIGRAASELRPDNLRNGAGSSAGRQSRASEILLTAGQQLKVGRSGVLDRVRSVDAARALAWTQGQLIFENAALADVIAEFNRYNRSQLRIDDVRLATRPVSGVFEANDVETLLAFIRQGGGEVRITHTEQGVVIGSSRGSAAPDDAAVQ